MEEKIRINQARRKKAQIARLTVTHGAKRRKIRPA